MSWAVSATAANGAIDVTPLAATLRFDQVGPHARFFPDTTTPVPAQTPREREEEEYAEAMAQRAANQAANTAAVASAAAYQQQQQQQQSQAQGSEPNTARSIASSTTYALHSLPPSQQASARCPAPDASGGGRRHTKKPSASTFVMTSMSTNVGAGARPTAIDTATPANTMTASSIDSQLLPLHAQEALKNEVAHLRRELSRQEAKLLDREATLAKVSSARDKIEQDKLADQVKMRQQVKELRKAVAEGDSRLEFWKADFHAQKAREMDQVQKDNAAIVEQLNAHLEAVGQTIKASATAMVPSASDKALPTAAGGQSSSSSSSTSLHIAFNGAGSGLTHEEHLRQTLERFKQERLEWERSRKAELTGLRQEHAVALAKKDHAWQKLHGQYTRQYADWKRQYAAMTAEFDFLTEYLVKLTYLLAEIDRGTYPVAQKHGVTSFVLPSAKRAFLKMDTWPTEKAKPNHSNSKAITAATPSPVAVMLSQKLSALAGAFASAGIPWDPAQVHTNQSFLLDAKQVEVRRLREERRDDLLRLQAGEEGGDGGEEEAATRLALPAASIPIEEKEESLDTLLHHQPHHAGGGGSGVDSSSNLQVLDAFHSELASHPTIQYIRQLEEERDRYKHQLAVETRKKLELHQTLTSQTRLVEGNELFKRSQLEQQSRRSSTGIPTGIMSQTSSAAHLLASGQAAHAGGGWTNPVYLQAHASPEKLHHSASAASAKALAIQQASSTIALLKETRRQGVQVGYTTTTAAANSSAAGASSSSAGQIGLTTGQFSELRASGSMGILTSPSKVVDHGETSHTASGAYRNANVRAGGHGHGPTPAHTSGGSGATMRPASAMVRGMGGYASPQPHQQQQQHSAYYGSSSRPLSAATTSYLGHGSSASSQGGTSTWNSRPTSAFIAGGSPVRPASAAVGAASTMSMSSMLMSSTASLGPASAGAGANGVGSSPARSIRSVHSASATMSPTPAYPLAAAAVGAPAAATPVAASASSFAKPTPMHVAHGNANATVYAQQLAKKAHADSRDHALGITHSPPPPPQQAPQESIRSIHSRTPSSSPTTERSTSRVRASSAGRTRIDQ